MKYRYHKAPLSWAEALDDHCNVSRLKLFARELAIKPIPAKKADIIQALLTALACQGLEHCYLSLPEIDQAAIAESLHQYQGSFKLSRFSAKYRDQPHINQTSSYYGHKHAVYLVDLFFFNDEIPDDLQTRLRQFVQPPGALTPDYTEILPCHYTSPATSYYQGLEEAPIQVRETEQEALSNLIALLHLAENGKIKVSSATGRPTATSLKTIGQQLLHGDWYQPEDQPEEAESLIPMQAFAWPYLLQAGGLLKQTGNQLKLTAAGTRTLQGKQSPSALKNIWKRWQKSKLLDEFSRIPKIKGKKSANGRALSAVDKRREIINQLLVHLTPGKWISVDALLKYAQAADYDFEVARMPYKLYIADAHYGYIGDNYAALLCNQPYWITYLFEYAATIGLIDIAYTQPAGSRPEYHDHWGMDSENMLSIHDGLLYLRLNELGHFIQGRTTDYTPTVIEQSPYLQVLANHDVVVTQTQRLTKVDRLYLDKIGQQDRESVWHLSQKSLNKAIEQGVKMADIQQFLTERAQGELPKNLLILFQDLEKKAQAFSYQGQAHLLSCTDPHLLALLGADKKLAHLCDLGKKTIAILPGSEKAFLKRVNELGYLIPELKQKL